MISQECCSPATDGKWPSLGADDNIKTARGKGKAKYPTDNSKLYLTSEDILPGILVQIKEENVLSLQIPEYRCFPHQYSHRHSCACRACSASFLLSFSFLPVLSGALQMNNLFLPRISPYECSILIAGAPATRNSCNGLTRRFTAGQRLLQQVPWGRRQHRTLHVHPQKGI